MEPRWTVYCHTHVASGRSYVGLTKKTMLARWNQHIYSAERKAGKGCAYFWAAIRKYGKNAFSHTVLGTFDSVDAANAAETRWIEELDSRNERKGFNLIKGGAHTPHPIRNPWDRPDYREKNAGRNTSTMLTPEALAKRMVTMATPESKVKRSDEAKKLWSNPEYRGKVTASNKIAYSDPEVRNRAATAMKESFATPESKAKRSFSTRAMWDDPSYRAKNVVSWENVEFREKCGSGLKHGASLNRAKTHCRNGHEFTSENTYINPRGSRECRECSRKSGRESARRCAAVKRMSKAIVDPSQEAS